MKYIFAIVALIQVATTIKVGKLSGALQGIQNATLSLAKVNTTSNETLKKIVNQAEQLHAFVQNGVKSGVKYSDDEVRTILGLNDGLYGMYYPYYNGAYGGYNGYHPYLDTTTTTVSYQPVYNSGYYPTVGAGYYPSYTNPWTPDYVHSLDSYRSRVDAESVLNYYKGFNDGEASVVIPKIQSGQAKAAE